MNKLFFDIALSGHHTEYISHIIDYILESKNDDNYFFVVNHDFYSFCPDIIKKSSSKKNITWVFIEESEYKLIQNCKPIKRSFTYFNLMNKYSKILNINSVTLLYFNNFQLPLIFYRPKYDIEGILFLQFTRMEIKNIKDKLKYLRKYLIVKLFIKNSKIKRIFLLNDNKSVLKLNDLFSTNKFKLIYDPIPIIQPLKNFDIFSFFEIESTKKIFLHFGSIGDRKGTFEILDSMLDIPKEKQSEIALLIVGKIASHELNKLKIKLSKISSETQISVIYHNKFVSNEFMKSLFNNCFCVLMPYKNTETSSGILGHAVSSNKKVIATDKGLIKELVSEGDFGYLIEDVKPLLIAKAIINSLEDKNPNIVKSLKTISFINNHTKEKFATALFQ